MTTSVISGATRAIDRPRPLTWAVVIYVVTNIFFPITFFLPLNGNEDIPGGAVALGVALSVLTIALCWPLWNAKRWAAIAITAITVFNTLSGIPALFEPPSGTIVALVIAGIPAAIIPIWLTWHPLSRRAYAMAAQR